MRYPLFITLLFLISCANHKSGVTGIYGHDKTLAYIYHNNGKAGLLDTAKNVILPAQFDYIEAWQVDGLIRVDSGGMKITGGDVVGYDFNKYGLVTISGQILFRPQFDELRVADNSALVRVDTLFGYVNDNGNWLIKPKYKVAYPFYKGTAVVQDSGDFVLLDKQGEKIISQTFDTIWSFKNDVAVVEKNKQWGFINYQGRLILPLDNYRGIGEYSWYFGKFQRDGKWFVIDTAGNIPIKEGFDEVETRGDEDSVFAVGKQNGKSVKIKLK